RGRPHPMVAGPAVPLPRPAAGALQEADGGERRAAVALPYALELGEEAARQPLLQPRDPGLELRHPLGHRRLLLLPAGELGAVALVELAEVLPPGGQVALRLLQPVEQGEGLL